MVVGLNIVARLKNKENVIFSNKTMIGCLSSYIVTENENFQPMNANFGILPKLDEKIKDKNERYSRLAKIALDNLT